MNRLPFVFALVVVVVLATAWAPADAAKRKRTACERLAGRDLAPDRKLKVVKREHDGTTVIRACTLRGGRVRTLISFAPESEFEYGTIDVEATTDRYVLLAEAYGERGSGRGLTRIDARNRRKTDITSVSCDPTQYCTGTEASEALMHRTGVVAIIVRDFGPCCALPVPTSAAKVVLVALDGTRTVLDEGPDLTGLKVEGDELVWARGGQPQRAPIGRP